MKINFRSERGYTGVDVAIAIAMLAIFTTIIATIFSNIYMQYVDGQRNATASAYMSSLAERIDRMYYNEVTQSGINTIIDGMLIPDGYSLTANVKRYVPEGYTESTSEDLVKEIEIIISYKVGSGTRTLKINKIKAKEILITPNKPKLSSRMVPVKYIEADEPNGFGYYQITSQNDSTWYNYSNKVWAEVMLIDGLVVEGGIDVSSENLPYLIGQKIITNTPVFAWIPSYAYNDAYIDFLYSTSNQIVDSIGNLTDLPSRIP